MLLLLLLSMVLSVQLASSLTTHARAPRPHCIIPAPPMLPKITDCLHIVRDIRLQNDEVHNRIFTVSRRRGSNIHLPNTWWDHVPHSTCAIHLDMADGRWDGHDELRLNDVLKTAEEVIEECLVPRSTDRWGGSEGVSSSTQLLHRIADF